MQDFSSKIWWLYVPIVAMVIQICMEVFLPYQDLSVLFSEGGLHETLQFIILVAALFVALTTIKHIDWKKQKWLVAWLGLAGICCFYVAGEEISWGQHLLNWSTPDYWIRVNDQGETNLHNTSSWFDQKPRILLFVGIIIGGLIVPALQKFKPEYVPVKFINIYPPASLMLIAALCLFVHILDDIDSALGTIVIFERASEIEELFMFYFVLLYLIALRRRVVH